MAPIWQPLTRENIISIVDPDVAIESFIIAEAERLKNIRSFTEFAGLALQDPNNNRRFIQRKLGKLNGMTKEEIDLTFPPTVDELQAEDENILINNDKLPPIGIRDDHTTHIEIHARANQNKYLIIHIRAHKKLMIIKRNRVDLFATSPEPTFQATTNNQPKEARAAKVGELNRHNE